MFTLHEVEKLFVQKYVRKHRRERMLLELSTDRRDYVLDNVCGDGMFLISGCMHPYQLTTLDALYCDMLRLGVSKENAHIMGISKAYDNDMPLYDALRISLFAG